MWLGARIGVVIPAYRERLLIRRTLARIPPFVDGVWVVDDGSDDGTAQAASSCSDPRLRVLEHPQNRGVGAAIVTGYRAALEAGSDVLAVMAGDDQMDPSDLEKVIDPVARHAAD